LTSPRRCSGCCSASLVCRSGPPRRCRHYRRVLQARSTRASSLRSRRSSSPGWGTRTHTARAHTHPRMQARKCTCTHTPAQMGRDLGAPLRAARGHGTPHQTS
jgi:hypothetical protein